MKLKSLLATPASFTLGRHLVSFAAGEEKVITDTPEAYADALVQSKLTSPTLAILDPGVYGQDVVVSYPRNATIMLAGVLADDTIVVGGVTFTFKAGSGQTTSNVGIGANDTAAATNLKAAINANATLLASGVSAKDILTVGTEARLTVELTGSLTVAGAGGSTGRANIAGTVKAVSAANPVKQGVFSLAGGAAEFGLYTGFATITSVVAQIRTSAGAIKTFDGNIYVGGGSIFLDDQGSADIGATDTVVLIVTGT